MGMNNIIIIVLIVVFLLLAMFFIPQWRLKRAIRQVIWIFKDLSAIGAKNAKTVDELGLSPKGMLEGAFRGRDYKQYALNALIKAEVLQTTEDGRFYLVEDKLISSGLDKGSSYYR